jgi:TonB family protein
MHNFQRSIAAAAIACALAAWWSTPASADQITYYQAPKFKVQVKPTYPQSARAAREVGVVFVKVLVGANGRPQSFTVRSSGHKDLDAAVLAAAKQSSYAPATKNGKPVAAFYDFSYKFTLAGLAENEGSDSDLAKRLQANPKSVPTRLALTEFYINRGDFTQAEATAQDGVKLSPNDARLWAQLGRAYYSDGSPKKDVAKLKQAAEAYDKSLSLDPHSPNTSQASAVYAEYAFNLMAGQQYNDCIPYAAKAAQLNPKEMQYRMLKGDCEDGAGNHEAALSDYQAAQPLDNKKDSLLTARLLADIGNAKLNMGDEAGGIEALNQSERANPHAVFAYQYLATYYIRKGNLNAALNPLSQLAQVQPTNVQVHVNMGDIYVRQKNFPAAQAAYNKALALDPKNADAQFGLAELAAAQGNLAQTDTALQRAVSTAPANTAIYNTNIAMLFLQTADHPGDAVKYALAATTADPNMANAWYALGIAYADTSKKDQANTALHKAFDLFKSRNDQSGMDAVNQAYMKLNGKDQSLMTGKGVNEKTNQPSTPNY